MINRRVFLVLIIIALSLISLQCTSKPDKTGIAVFLPEKGESGNWNPVDTIQVYAGDDLFLLINGGAEIYQEYGFKQVAAREYSSGEKTITVELFEMDDPLSAFGMYSFKTGKSGEDAAIGDEGLLSDYYLNVRKGNYLLTVTGYDSETETVAGLLALAKEIAGRLPGIGAAPDELIAKLPPEDLIPRSVVYIQGPLALQNIYHFGGDIFSVKEGIIGEYPDEYQVILTYAEKAERDTTFKYAQNACAGNPIFKTIGGGKDRFSGTDDNNRKIVGKKLGEADISVSITKAK